jgi:hypothetical protein
LNKSLWVPGFPRTGNPPGVRVLRNGERIRVLGSAFSGTGNSYSTGFAGFRVPKNGEYGKIRSPRSFENRVPIHKNPSEFRVLVNGEPIVDFAFPVLGNAEPACVPVSGNPEPACVPCSRERNPKLTPLLVTRWTVFQSFFVFIDFIVFKIVRSFQRLLLRTTRFSYIKEQKSMLFIMKFSLILR